MYNYMKTITLIFTFIILYGCADNNRKGEKEKTKYYYLSYYSNGRTSDTLKYEEINTISSIDELVATEYFEYLGTSHVIKMYNSDNRAPADGGGLKYTLDSIGIIYSRPIWWPNFGRLSSNNDSINNLLNTAYGFMLMKKSLRCFYCDEEFTHIPPNAFEIK
jgi:hypothetical protein